MVDVQALSPSPAVLPLALLPLRPSPLIRTTTPCALQSPGNRHKEPLRSTNHSALELSPSRHHVRLEALRTVQDPGVRGQKEYGVACTYSGTVQATSGASDGQEGQGLH